MTSRATKTLAVVAWVLASAPVALAQTPEQRATIETFRNELAAIGDSTLLLARESDLMARARADRDNPLLHLQLGFLAYRLGEMTAGRPHYDDAGSEFEWTLDLEPDWPYAWYGLGLAELALGEHSVIAIENLRQALGLDHLSKAAKAFAQAAEVDPSFALAVVDLATTAMQQRVRPRLQVALEAVRRAAATSAGEVPLVQLARGRVEREFGEGDSALTAFQRYLEVGGDSGVGLLEVARTLYFGRRPVEGARTYYRGAEVARSPEAVALYRDDIAWIAKPDELVTFDSTASAAARAEWLHRFWESRDVADARRPGDRLEEHYRRYFYALRHYRLVSRHRKYDVVNPYRNSQTVFDDRGIIYLRHGTPTRTAIGTSLALEPNESWLYARRDGDLVFHFVARGDVQDYKLVESLLDVLGLETAVRIQSGAEPLSQASGLFDSRTRLSPLYQRLSSASSSPGLGPMLATERRAGARSIAAGTTTDSYPLTFELPLNATVQQYVVSDSSGVGAELLLVFAVPGPSLVAQALGGGLAYPVEMRAVVSTPDDSVVAFVDTTRMFLTSTTLAPNQHLAAFVEVPVPEGSYDVRVVLSQPGRGVGDVLTAEGVTVFDTSSQFTVSDLIVGRAGSGLTWVHGPDTLGLNPLRTFPEGARLQLYYEIHGLERGAGYRSRVEVKKQGGGSIFGAFKKLFGGGGPPIAITFDGVAEGPVTRVSQSVDLKTLKPGRYRLRVTVTDPVGDRRHVREDLLEVIGT